MAAIEACPAPTAADSAAVSRPAGLWLLTVALLVGPIVHLVALWLDRQWLNLGSRRAWDGFVLRSDCSRWRRFSTSSSPQHGASTRRWTHAASSSGFGPGEGATPADRFARAASALAPTAE